VTESAIQYIFVVDIFLFGMLAITAFAILRLRSLFAVVALSGVYSLLTAGLFVTLDAVDVAFTEAAVGAGVSTILMLGALSLTSRREKVPTHTPLLPLAIVFITGGAVIYGTVDIPNFGDPNAPIHHRVAPEYIQESDSIFHIPNVVTNILASYRSYDTLGETVVIFTAGVAVITLLGSGLVGREK